MNDDLLENKYTKWYNHFIETRKFRQIHQDQYTEIHHIIPRSLGGSDSRDNLITLTAKEHFFAHLLLANMFSGNSSYKMVAAVNALKNLNSNGRRYICNSREYHIIRSIQSRIQKTIASDHEKVRILQGDALSEYTDVNKVIERGTCISCGILPRAVNYIRGTRTFYRKMCDSCSRAKNNSPQVPKWVVRGYKKKHTCECCGFKSEYREQLVVIEIAKDFKTICLNCHVAIKLGKTIFESKVVLKDQLSIKADF